MVIIEAMKLEEAYGSAEMIERPSIYLPAIRPKPTHTYVQATVYLKYV